MPERLPALPDGCVALPDGFRAVGIFFVLAITLYSRIGGCNATFLLLAAQHRG
jgi:hypothetical protein